MFRKRKIWSFLRFCRIAWMCLCFSLDTCTCVCVCVCVSKCSANFLSVLYFCILAHSLCISMQKEMMKATASMENRIYFRSYFLFLKFYLCFCLKWENESWLSIVVHFFRSLWLSRNSNHLHSYNDPKDNREWFFSLFVVASLSLAAVALFQTEIFIMKNFGICECRYCVWLLFSLNVCCGLCRMRQHQNYRICGIVKCVMFFSVLFCSVLWCSFFLGGHIEWYDRFIDLFSIWVFQQAKEEMNI